jgi:glycosyltransferase involved in cell wall biosynthesis
MRLSGFTFLRNAVRFDYPAVESIRSILPIVDEFIVNVGPDDDGTLDLVNAIGDPKIKIIRSQWNPNLTTGGYIYAQQTNIALFNCSGRWAFYLQADEVVHEADLPRIVEAVDRYDADDRVEGLALDELTFWGDYQTIVNVYPWGYSRRCWVIKPHRFVLSRGDAAGFTVHPKYKEHGHKIRVVDTGARVFHYSFVKSQRALAEKYKTVFGYWKETFAPEDVERVTADLYNSWFPRCFVGPYDGTHPAVMAGRIAQHSVRLDLDSPRWRRRLSFADRKRLFQTWWIKQFGDRFIGRGSYRLVRP